LLPSYPVIRTSTEAPAEGEDRRYIQNDPPTESPEAGNTDPLVWVPQTETNDVPSIWRTLGPPPGWPEVGSAGKETAVPFAEKELIPTGPGRKLRFPQQS
jgi:hypothetical protein